MNNLETIGISRRHFAAVSLSAGAALLAPSALFAEGTQPLTSNLFLADLPTVKPGTNTSFGPLKQIEAKGYRVIVPYLRGYGTTSFLSGATMRNAQQSAVGLDIIALMDALKIQQATVAGFDWGARTADVMAVLWPERCKAIVSVSGYLISSPAGNQTPFPPQAAFAFWYQYYFATEVGKAGYAKYLDEFNKFIWHQASPKWNFDDATYNRSAASFNNPDHVDIVMHDYRWRLGLADGERKYDELEKRLAALPVVTVPAITMEGDSNGAIHAPSAAYRNKFSGKYDYRLITGGVGHNLPQEAPEAFAQAIFDVDHF
jgi:pimeloyl-ACP methyl ester carboxylesterase